jgi:rSAM/selenodomain-associated transferase 1
MEKHLIIFIKNPEVGKVKTRLAQAIGEEQALFVYRDLLDKCRTETSLIQANRHLFYASTIDFEDEWEKGVYQKHLQSEGDLGKRITAAFREVFSQGEGPKKVLIIGSDCYDLSRETMEEAFQLLDKSDLVLGPANDGGYYLLGMKSFNAQLFEGIDWSTEKVLEQTLSRAKTSKWKVEMLIELVDLDTIEDLEKSGYKLKQIRK